jgi:hypothetical protein
MIITFRKYNIFTFTENYDNAYGSSYFWNKVAEVNASLDEIKNVMGSVSNNVKSIPKIIFNVNDFIFDQINSVQGKKSATLGEFLEPGAHLKSEFISTNKEFGKPVSNKDVIEILFLGTMRFRRCTIYLVIQFSYLTLKVRILAYGTDEILHNGGSFGTDLENVNKDLIVQSIDNFIKERLLSKNLNINCTALEKIKKGNYTLFV